MAIFGCSFEEVCRAGAKAIGRRAVWVVGSSEGFHFEEMVGQQNHDGRMLFLKEQRPSTNPLFPLLGHHPRKVTSRTAGVIELECDGETPKVLEVFKLHALHSPASHLPPVVLLTS